MAPPFLVLARATMPSLLSAHPALLPVQFEGCASAKQHPVPLHKNHAAKPPRRAATRGAKGGGRKAGKAMTSATLGNMRHADLAPGGAEALGSERGNAAGEADREQLAALERAEALAKQQRQQEEELAQCRDEIQALQADILELERAERRAEPAQALTTTGPSGAPSGNRSTTADGSSSSGSWHRLLLFLTRWTKWGVLISFLSVVVSRPNAAAAWLVIGATANGVAAKLFKRLLNHDRPVTARGRKDDPGMPSSHAQSLAFLCTYAAVTARAAGWPVGGSVAVALAGAFLASLRVWMGLHTWPQVIVGASLGCSYSLLWLRLWRQQVSSALRASLQKRCAAGMQPSLSTYISSPPHLALVVIALTCSLMFSSKVLSGWLRDRKNARLKPFVI